MFSMFFQGSQQERQTNWKLAGDAAPPRLWRPSQANRDASTSEWRKRGRYTPALCSTHRQNHRSWSGFDTPRHFWIASSNTDTYKDGRIYLWTQRHRDRYVQYESGRHRGLLSVSSTSAVTASKREASGEHGRWPDLVIKRLFLLLTNTFYLSH